MPREVIVPATTYVYDEKGFDVDQGTPGHTLPAPEGGSSHTTPQVELNWSREHEHVQVSIEFAREDWIAIAKELEDAPEVSRKAIFSPGLSRYQINKLIRTLRRARDAAFGVDE